MQLNDNTSHPSAFISSTFLDLKAERHAVAETLGRAGINVNALDVRPASTNTARQEILGGIRESDFVIVIIANRYGSFVRYLTHRNTSVTEWEYEMAAHYGKSIHVYFKQSSSLANSNVLATEGAAEINRLKQFRERLERTHSPRYFASTGELAQHVSGSLIQVYREGVRHHIRRTRPLEEKITAMEKLLAAKDRHILDLEAKVNSSTRSRTERLLAPPFSAMSPATPAMPPPSAPYLDSPQKYTGLEALGFPRPLALPKKPGR